MTSSRFGLFIGVLFLATGLAGCRAPSTLPAVNVSAPGWQVHQGQAVWTPNHKRPEMAGELFLARHASGDCLVQFTKPPFTIVEARQTGQSWVLDFGSGQKVWRGTGKPPARVVWFQLARARSGAGMDGRWSWTRDGEGAWILTNQRTGERLEGQFF